VILSRTRDPNGHASTDHGRYTKVRTVPSNTVRQTAIRLAAAVARHGATK
jgi:hypothetical protein